MFSLGISMKFLVLLTIAISSFCVSAESDWKKEHAKYIERNKKTDVGFENVANASLFEDKNFIRECWDKVSSQSVFLYYTVKLDGSAEDIKWFPQIPEAKCIEAKIKTHLFPKPKEVAFIQLMVWDGEGG